MQNASSGRDHGVIAALKNAFDAKRKQIIRLHDLIELEPVREQRQSDRTRFDCTINMRRRIRSFPPGQSVVTIL